MNSPINASGPRFVREPIACNVYARIGDENQILFVREDSRFPVALEASDWRFVASGVQAPDGATQIRTASYHQTLTSPD